jgi:putative Holliday junction resolvase
MRILALDLGDRWIGSALSDASHIIATPYKTIEADQLESFIATTIPEYRIETVVLGLPQTLRGTESEQTKKVYALKEALEQKFTNVAWVFWDERLTSKQATQIKRPQDKADKLQSHSVAAAIILRGYLDHLYFLKNH